jgi:hypothetical protein
MRYRNCLAWLRSLRNYSFICALVVLGSGLARAEPSPDQGWDWTVTTLARDGSWGVATESSLARAIGLAIGRCKAMSVPQSDCGAQFTIIRAGWTLALLCGEHKVLAAAKHYHEAWRDAQLRIDLKKAYLPELPPCRQIINVDPAGAVIFPGPTSSDVPSR